MRVLALDVGTSSVKAAVLDAASGQTVSPLAYAAYSLDHPTPEAAEVPTSRLWSAVAAAAREASLGIAGVEGVGFSCMTPALVLLDRADQPVLPIWTHLDRRARPAARQVWAAVGEEFLATAGNRPLPGGISAVCWRQQLADDPYLSRRVAHYLHLNGWLAFHLTGERAFDPANAGFTGLFGTVTDQTWSERWCEFFQVEPSWLPAVVPGDTTVGHLRSALAAELGVPAGLPVKLGTADTSCAMLASGMTEGDLLHVVGTTQVLAVLTGRPQPSPRRLVHHLGVGPLFTHVTHNPVGGVALDWMHRLCFRDLSALEFFDRAVAGALHRQTRVTLDPPYLGGDRLELDAQRAAFRDLTVTTDREDLLAALLQAMRRRHGIAVDDLGVAPKFRRVFLTGGGADVIRRLLPEYEGAGLHPLEEGSLLGVARLFQPGPRSMGAKV